MTFEENPEAMNIVALMYKNHAVMDVGLGCRFGEKILSEWVAVSYLPCRASTSSGDGDLEGFSSI